MIETTDSFRVAKLPSSFYRPGIQWVNRKQGYLIHERTKQHRDRTMSKAQARVWKLRPGSKLSKADVMSTCTLCTPGSRYRYNRR
jgi:hypothetical protein